MEFSKYLTHLLGYQKNSQHEDLQKPKLGSEDPAKTNKTD